MRTIRCSACQTRAVAENKGRLARLHNLRSGFAPAGERTVAVTRFLPNRVATRIFTSLNEERRFAIWPDAATKPFPRVAAERRNRFARLPFCNSVTQRHDRQKAGTFGGRSLERDLHR